MKIFLLTHERELERPSNTGNIVLEATAGSGLVQRVVWHRTNPDPNLLAEITRPATGVVYPVSEVAGPAVELPQCEQFVLLDATWQEARKMYNRSPYLHTASRVNLDARNQSVYALRRNQKSGGLCTAECVAEILRQKGESRLADKVLSDFLTFNSLSGRSS